MSGTMRFMVQFDPRQRAELEVVNPLELGGEIMITADWRVFPDGDAARMVYGAKILDIQKEPGNPDVIVVTLELPDWELIPDLGRPIDPATIAAIKLTDRHSSL